MPKELTHWHIAREVVKRGVPPQMGEIIAQNPALYYMGSVAHDIAFYDLSEPTEASIERVGNQLHGVEGENTLVPICDMMDAALNQKNPQALFAFLLGMLTHFVADSTFHPMVYYMSGNYFAEDPEERGKAMFRHRLLETAMDLWLKTVDPMEYPENLIHLWHEAGDSGRQALAMLVEHYATRGDKSIMSHFKSAWRNHRLLQAVFSWTAPWRMLALYRRFGHPSVEKHEALFYPQPLDLSFFEEQLDWRHPVTGEHYMMTLDELYDLSVNKVSLFFNQFGIQPQEAWSKYLRTVDPLSLDTGLPYVAVKEMKFFRKDPIEHYLKV